MSEASGIPGMQSTITPHLVINGAPEAIAF